MSDLSQALRSFVGAYHGAETLVAAQRDWHCSVALVASDSEETLGLEIEAGRVRELERTPSEVDLVVTAERSTLLGILEFRRDPSEAYLCGELTIGGAEAHFTRLDWVVTGLCRR